MFLYADSEFPVRNEIAAVHTRQLKGIVAPGTWGTGAQRRTVAAEARKAGYDAGLLEPPPSGPEQPDIELPESTRRVIRTLATSVQDLDQPFCDSAIADGLSDAEYVEIVGVVSRIVDLDVFARGIGVPPRSLPSAESGTPTRDRPDTAVIEYAWVPTIPNGPDGGAIGEDLYHGNPMPYIVRAMSLVPDELRAHVELEIAHYTRLDKLFDYDYQHHEGLTRPQAEVVAGRVSALNDCFYWTLYHARFLRESGRKHQLDVNLEALVRPEVDAGVPGSAELLEFAEAVISTDRSRLDAARLAIADNLSSATVTGASAIAGNFSKNDRIANAIGIPIDPNDLQPTKAIRAQLGLNDFKSAVNTFRHFSDS